MEYVYAALLLHKLKQEINEDNIKNVIKATGVEPDEVKVKALVAALSEVDIDEALKSAPVAVAAPVAAPSGAPGEAKAEEKKEEEEEEKKGEEEAMAGLSALFG
ncbi:MAG: 50S ribosomal protein P1 [Candidatus Nitrosocaldaceae archaeon]|nr:MAG: 50S ribosomal protein P1 [Candidatus Nitrosocaldaceae archaeon]